MSTLSPMQRVTFEKSIVVFLAKFTTYSCLTRDLYFEYQILDRNSLDLDPNALSISCL